MEEKKENWLPDDITVGEVTDEFEKNGTTFIVEGGKIRRETKNATV